MTDALWPEQLTELGYQPAHHRLVDAIAACIAECDDLAYEGDEAARVALEYLAAARDALPRYLIERQPDPRPPLRLVRGGTTKQEN